VYLNHAQWSLQVGQSKKAIEHLKEGLKELPNTPLLLLMLGKVYGDTGKVKACRETLLQAYQAAPQNVMVVGHVAHELLHVDAGDVVESLLPQIRQIPGLQSSFWVDQGEQVLGCELEQAWARRFFEEALALIDAPQLGKTKSDDSKAGILLDIYEAAVSEQDNELVQEYQQRIRAEVPNSGAVEYVEAFEASHQQRDMKKTRRLLRSAVKRATRAKDQGVLRRAQAIEATLGSGLAGPFGLGNNLETLQRMLAGTMFGAEDNDDLDDLF
jgi:hypothetical protein